MGGVGNEEEAPLEVGFEEEEVLVGAPASGLAEKGLFGHAPGREVAAAHLPFAIEVLRALPPATAILRPRPSRKRWRATWRRRSRAGEGLPPYWAAPRTTIQS